MSETGDAELDLDVLMQQIRADVARRRAAAGRADPAAAAHADPAPGQAQPGPAVQPMDTIALSRLPESGGSIAVKDRYALAEFLAYQDEDFVRNAYRGILRREPDADGLTAFLEALRQGRMSKAEVLGRMRFSAEGRAVGVSVRSLPVAFALRSARRVPVLGRMLGIAEYLFRLPVVVRNHERLESAYFQHRFELSRQINAVEVEIECQLTQVRHALQDMEAAIRASVDRMREAVAASSAPHREIEARLVAVERALEFKADSENLTRLTNRFVEQLERRPERADLEALATEFGAARREYTATVTALAANKADQARVEAIMARVDELQIAKTDAAEFEAAIGELRDKLIASGRALHEQERRLAVLVEEAGRAYSGGGPGSGPNALAQEDDHRFDAFYAAFECEFRGTPEDIRERVAVYLPTILESGAGTPDAPVLDIGCGRGEWLELLKESGLAAQGVDLNRVTVAACRERELAVVEGDAIEYLRRLEANSLGAVTAIHVIEHLPFRRLMVLLDEVLRALRPGGVAIFETPNPENLIVGACGFYYDPTHERPLPPESMRFIAESRKFVEVSLLRLHPVPESLQLIDGAPAVRELVNRVLYGPQDYALVARKPV